jgi:hypothetical protein
MRKERQIFQRAMDQVRNIDDADVVNMSFGFPPQEKDSAARRVNRAVSEEGIMVVAAAGNEGPEYNTITSPGIARNAVTVGSCNLSRRISGFSSRGPTNHEFRVKPDLVALGENIVGASPTTKPNEGQTTVKSGTSFAVPIVVGGIGLILQAHPEWSHERIKNALVTTAEPLSDGDGLYDIYTQGAGVAQIEPAVDTNIIVMDSIVNFGCVQAGRELSKEIRIQNLDTETKTLDIEYMMQEVHSGLDLSQDVNIQPDRITIPQESVGLIQLTVDTTGNYGIHSGRILYDDTELKHQYTSLFGYTS